MSHLTDETELSIFSYPARPVPTELFSIMTLASSPTPLTAKSSRLLSSSYTTPPEGYHEDSALRTEPITSHHSHPTWRASICLDHSWQEKSFQNDQVLCSAPSKDSSVILIKALFVLCPGSSVLSCPPAVSNRELLTTVLPPMRATEA